MKSTLRQAAGSLLVVGLGGTELTSLERAWLRLIRPGGIILFKRNITDAAQTRALLDEATGFCAPHAARFVDVEGGTEAQRRTFYTALYHAVQFPHMLQEIDAFARARDPRVV